MNFRFSLGGLLGSGASASVFLATESSTGTVVAVKVLHPHIAVRPKQVARFLEEALKMQGVLHPNIARVIAWGSNEEGEEPSAWIAYELARGISLVEYVETFGPLTPADTALLAQGVLAALGALHRAGLVHRDVSPQNVIIDVESRNQLSASNFKLIDYGLVGKAGSSTRTKSGVIGNAHYVSPEQARGAGVYASGDIYQTGAVLYFALTGQTPFSGETTEALINAHQYQTPPVPSAIRTGVPRELDRAIVKSMLKSPTMRYRNVEEFSLSLAAIFGRDATATEVLPSPNGAFDQTKVFEVGQPHSFVDLDRTMLLATSAAEAESARSALSDARPGHWRRLTIATWFWPSIFGVLLISAVVLSVVSAQPGMRDFAPITSQISSIEPTVTGTPSVSADSEMVNVPNLNDLTPQQARLVLEGLGLVVNPEKRIDSAYPVDHVINSEPAAGSSVAPGSSIALTVATGRNIVPQVAGLSAQEAQEQLSAAGFICTLLGADGVPIPDASTQINARVVQIRPSGGSLLKVGSTVISILDLSGSVAPTPIPPVLPLPSTTGTPAATANPQP